MLIVDGHVVQRGAAGAGHREGTEEDLQVPDQRNLFQDTGRRTLYRCLGAPACILYGEYALYLNLKIVQLVYPLVHSS